MLFTTLPAQTQSYSVNGHDWHLPAWVKETPNAGWAWCNAWFAQQWEQTYPIDAPVDEVYFVEYKYLVWADVHKAQGVLDWSAVDSWIAMIEKTPHLGFAFFPSVFARMLDGDRGTHTGAKYMVPHWLETDGFDGKKVRFYPGSGEPTGWEPDSGYLPALTEFITALGERYRNHPRFAYIDIRCMDAVYGEGQLRNALAKNKMDSLQNHYGYSPEAYESFMKAQFDLYGRVFAGQERKCIIQNFDVGQAGPPGFYEGAVERVWQYGLAKGFGGRDGQVENLMRYLNLGYGLCNDPRNNHFIIFEDTFPVFRKWEENPQQGPIWLTENEEWGYDNRLGPKENGRVGWFASCLRALHMRRSHIGISHHAVFLEMDFSRYVQLSCGKTRRTSADAWCWLRQANNWAWMTNLPADTALIGTDRSAPEGGWLYTNYGYPKEYDFLNWERGNITFKNFERWLYQYDARPDGVTRTTEMMDISDSGWSSDQDRDPYKLYAQDHAGANNGKEYWARRTDHKSKNNAMYFKIESKWYRNYAGAVEILVTYKDVNECVWQLEVDDLNGNRQISGPITTSATEEWKTVSFALSGLKAAGGFTGDNDFRLLRTDGGDLVVQFVRIIKLAEHTYTEVESRTDHESNFILYSAFPNPFNAQISIRFMLPKDGHVKSEIYDLTGRLVKTLTDAHKSAGEHRLLWDGTNINGFAVATGIYLCRLITENSSQAFKMALIK